jgi:hypothetical protein
LIDLQRGNDDLGTPEWFLDIVRQLGPIALDPCSNRWSLVRAEMELFEGRDCHGLVFPWATLVRPGALCYVNPPYSNPMPWCERIVEAADAGLEIVALLKLDPSTKSSKLIRDRRDAKCDLDKRISFEGGKYKTGAIASTVAYFGARPYLFCHLFQDVGEVHAHGRRAV